MSYSSVASVLFEPGENKRQLIKPSLLMSGGME